MLLTLVYRIVQCTSTAGKVVLSPLVVFVFLLNSPMLVTLVCRLVQVDPSHFAASTEGSVVLAE